MLKKHGCVVATKYGCITTFICMAVLVAFLIYSNNSFSEVVRCEEIFNQRILEYCSEDRKVLLSDIIQDDWEYIYIFRAYDTKDTKYRRIGYYFGRARDLIHEPTMSLFFMKDEKVVFYVDALLSEDFMYYPKISADKVLRSEKPFLDIYRNEYGGIQVVLDKGLDT